MYLHIHNFQLCVCCNFLFPTIWMLHITALRSHEWWQNYPHEAQGKVCGGDVSSACYTVIQIKDTFFSSPLWAPNFKYLIPYSLTFRVLLCSWFFLYLYWLILQCAWYIGISLINCRHGAAVMHMTGDHEGP